MEKIKFILVTLLCMVGVMGASAQETATVTINNTTGSLDGLQATWTSDEQYLAGNSSNPLTIVDNDRHTWWETLGQTVYGLDFANGNLIVTVGNGMGNTTTDHQIDIKAPAGWTITGCAFTATPSTSFLEITGQGDVTVDGASVRTYNNQELNTSIFTFHVKHVNGAGRATATFSNFEVTLKKNTELYTVTCTTAVGGSVQASHSSAYVSEIVKLTSVPEYGYVLQGYTVTDENNNEIAVSPNSTFVMPASNVTVSATFAKADKKFALKSAGTIDTTKKYLIVCQETSGSNADMGILMNGQFTAKTVDGYPGASQVPNLVEISTNIIYQTSYDNTFTFEKANNSVNNFYIKNNANRYIGNRDASSVLVADNEQYLMVNQRRGNNYINTVIIDGDTRIIGSYNSMSLNYEHTTSSKNSQLFFYGAANEYGGKIYLYEEVDDTNPDVPEKLVAKIGAIGDEKDGKGEHFYGTFSSDKAVKFDDGVNVYSVSDLEESTLVLSQISDNIVPANTGVILKTVAKASQDMKIYYAPYQEVTTDKTVGTNMLYPASKNKSELSGNKFYMLSYGDKDLTPTTLGFYWGAANGGAFKSREGSAYLAVPVSSSAKSYTFAYSEYETDGISNVKLETGNQKPAYTYNLAGQRIENPVRGQLYIKNGRKFIAK